MLKIGYFAKLGQVSVKTLRWYDELGLLKPTQVDGESGYRYYSIEQLPRLNRILALKGLGLSLEQIAVLLGHDLPAEQLRGMLRLKQAELRQRIAEEQSRLVQVEARLRQIEDETMAYNYDVVLKRIEPALVASIREVIATYPDVGRLTAEIYTFLEQLGLDGVDGAVWHDSGPVRHSIEAEGVVFLECAVPPTERVKVYHLPAVEQMACVIHHGAYRDLHRAYVALQTWIEANGHRVSGPLRDIYHHGGTAQDDAGYITEVQFPI